MTTINKNSRLKHKKGKKKFTRGYHGQDLCISSMKPYNLVSDGVTTFLNVDEHKMVTNPSFHVHESYTSCRNPFDIFL